MRRALIAAGALALAACGAPVGLVDQVEDGRAIVVAPDGTAEVLAVGPEVREGDWLVGGRPAPRARERRVARIARLRAELANGDRGGTVVLGEGR